MKPEPGGRSVASRKSDVPRADESWMLTCGMKREDDWVPLLIAQMQLDAAKLRANPNQGDVMGRLRAKLASESF